MKLIIVLTLFSQIASAQGKSYLCSAPTDKFGNTEKMKLTFNPNGELASVMRISGWHWCSDRKVSKIRKVSTGIYKLSYIQLPRERKCFESSIRIVGPNKIEHLYDNEDGSYDAPRNEFTDTLICK